MSKKGQKALASATVMSLVLTTALTTMPAMAATTVGTPISGTDRVATSIAIAEKAYANKDWTTSTNAVIASGADASMVDALAVAPLAYQKKAPILLTDKKGVLTDAVITELTTRKITNVYLIGAACTDANIAKLAAAKVTVTKYQGADREATADAINAELEKLGAPKAYAVVDDHAMADALSIAAIAASQNYEIVLSKNNTVAKDLTGKTVYAVGGSGVLSDALVSSLKATRLSQGTTRYGTNAAVLAKTNANFDTTYVADGTNDHLVDALAGSVLAAQTSSPIVLVNTAAGLDADVTTAIKAQAGKVNTVTAIGGAVTTTVTDAVKAAAVATDLTVEVSATGAKKLTVKFNQAVDTTKAAITVKKGTVSVNTDSVVFAADKMSATITTTTKLSAGDYTVSVAGLSTTAVTATVTATDEKVSKIDLTSTKAPRLSGLGGEKKALVSYEVLNQYGEAMTGQAITWTISTGVAVANENTTNCTFEITAANGADFVPGAIVYITGVNATSGTVFNGQVEIALASQADAVTFKGVYDTTKQKLVDLPAGFDNGRYLLLFQVDDQYGNVMDTPDLSKLVFTSNNPLFVSSTLTPTSPVTTVTIDDVVYQSVPLVQGTTAANGGSVTIQAISTITGKTSTFTTKADALAAIKSFTMSAPTKMVAEGETVEVPFTAVDQYGNPVTSFASLDGHVTLTPAANLQFVKQDDGSAKLMYTAPTNVATSTADYPVYMTSVVTNGGNFSSIMINVKAVAVPTAIVGLDSTSDIATSIANGNYVDITPADLVVQDQYGRTMSDTAVATWLDKTTPAAVNSIVVTSDDTATTPITVLLNGTGSDSDTQVMATSGASVRLTAQDVTAASENIKFTLATGNDGTGAVATSAKSITFTKVDQSAYTSYEVADLGTMYNDGAAGTVASTNYDKTLKVYGVMANGTKVLLPNTDYTVTTDGKLTVDSAPNTNVITDMATGGYATTDFQDASGNYADVKVNVIVTVNDPTSHSAIAILPKELVVSDKAPKVATVTLDEDTVTDGKAVINPAVAAINDTLLKSFIYSVKDQYGVADTEVPTITITNLTKVDGSAFTVSNNGTATTSIASVALGDKFTATFKYASGVTAKVDFTVGLPQ